MPSSNAAYQALIDVVLDARTEVGITQTALANKLKRPQSFIGKIESGARNVDVIEFIEIARALKIDPTKLLSRVVQKTGL